ncbi:hypothetical protein HII31_00243 [Pseudocercospora fuligena]|uniref:ADP-ribosylglycohydrolase n=1 Tax=Pseudocercospora fuligena TaxID=685502 RepID=A0A8H6RW11_9PEZI|nr:hypothetical protein HII31_00243 [Pseudocercospora fuligena]
MQNGKHFADDKSLRGRNRAIIYGIAYGDALGATVEGLTPEQIRAQYGRVTSLDVDWHKKDDPQPLRAFQRVRGGGITTDDTQMALCLMATYVHERRHLDAWDLADHMLKEIAWRPRYIPELQKETALLERLFYAEKWIFNRHQLTSCDPRQGGIGNMVNCGAAMYIAPIGAANAGDPARAYNEAIAFATGHQESYGLEAAAVLSAAVAAAFIPGATIETIITEVLLLAKDGTKAAIQAIVDAVPALRGKSHSEVTAGFHAAIAPFSPIGEVIKQAPKNGVPAAAYRPSRFLSIEEVPIALGFALINDGDFRETIIDGINSGRDTDSIGVMAGTVLGALHGAKVIDRKLLKQLDTINKFDLMQAADDFTMAVEQIHKIDAEDARRVAETRLACTNNQSESSKAYTRYNATAF